MNSESNFWKHLLRDFCWRNLIKMKVEAKEREKSHRFSFFLVEGLNWLLLIGKFCASPVIMWRKMQLTFILTCFVKYDFFVDFFVVTNQANNQDYSGIYSWGRHCISWSYTRTPRFLYLRTAFGHLSRGNFCQSMSIFNKPPVVYDLSQHIYTFFFQKSWNSKASKNFDN